MSSNIKISRICNLCKKEFIARTTVTQYCSDSCAKRAYKLRIKEAKIEMSNLETQNTKSEPLLGLKTKEFLTVKDVANLLDCSVRSVYYFIESGNLKAVNLSERTTRIRRVDLDKIFEQKQSKTTNEKSTIEAPQYQICDCYSTSEVREKFGISESTLRSIIIKNNIPKFRKGILAYIPKILIDKLLKN